MTTQRSRLFWLPPLVTAVFASSLLSGAILFVLSAAPYVALAAGALACAALTWSVAKRFGAVTGEAVPLACLAGANAIWVQFGIWSGVS